MIAARMRSACDFCTDAILLARTFHDEALRYRVRFTTPAFLGNANRAATRLHRDLWWHCASRMRPPEFTGGTSDAVFIHIHECPRKPVAVLSFLPARFLLAHRPNKRPGASPSWTETTCIGSSSPVHGGWDSLARRPLPVRSVLPPGSVLFCEILNTGPRALRGDGCRRRRRGAYRFAHGVRLRPRGRRRLARCRRLIQRHGDFQIPSACLGSVSGPRGYRRPRLARDRAHALLCVRICGGL